jgi:hypothetical protein
MAAAGELFAHGDADAAFQEHGSAAVRRFAGGFGAAAVAGAGGVSGGVQVQAIIYPKGQRVSTRSPV